MSDYYPVDAAEVRKNGMRGVLSTGAGIGLILFNTLLNVPVIGWILSGGLVALGVMGLAGKGKADKATGTVMMAAGGLGIASFLFKGLTGFLLGAGGLALIGFGVFSLVKFRKGLKSRS